jgi:hypothetical protein
MMDARHIRLVEAACPLLVIRSHNRSVVVMGVAGEVVTVTGELWKRVVELDDVLKRFSI